MILHNIDPKVPHILIKIDSDICKWYVELDPLWGYYSIVEGASGAVEMVGLFPELGLI